MGSLVCDDILPFLNVPFVLKYLNPLGIVSDKFRTTILTVEPEFGKKGFRVINNQS